MVVSIRKMQSMVKCIESERLLLFPVPVSLAESLLAGNFAPLTAAGLCRAAGWPRGDTLVIMSFIIMAGETAGPCWLAVRKSDHCIVGDLGCKGLPDSRGEVEIGYGIAGPERRKGYGYESVQAMIDYLRSRPEVRCITAECLADNYPSIRILQRAGMRIVGSGENRLRWQLV